MMSPNDFSVAVVIALVLLGLVLAVLWILLPFAVFSIRGRMKDALAAQQRTNELLEQLLATSRSPGRPGPPADRD